ncbi:MAG TPA: hypothetical protein VFG23_24005 [Polyangia bacterium]|nr:hypothetical protein [Polyangia bacterium]
MRRALCRFGGFGVFGALGAALALTGCGKVDDSAFAGSVPTKDTVAAVLPGGTTTTSGSLTAGGTTTRKGALLGAVAADYQSTVAVTTIINGAVGAVLDLVKTVISYPATSVDDQTAVWGPHTDPLSANTWRLTVTRVAPHEFNWKFDGRAKTSTADSDFVTVLSGTHTQALDAAGHAMEGFGSGNFTLDWDAADTLPQHDTNVGQAAFTYSRLDPTATVAVGVTFTNIVDNCAACSTKGQIFDALYAYSATPGNGGDLQYGADENFNPATAAIENLSLHSRWMETGAGRSDIQVSGGDYGTTVNTSSECWDSNFASQYSITSYDPNDPNVDWGSESSCAFPSAAFVSLAPAS